MKAHQKRIRVLRRLALAGCLAAGLAIPTTAGAMLPNDAPNHLTHGPSQQPYTLPSNFRSEVQSQAQPYSLPSRFRTESQSPAATPTPAPVQHAGFALRRSFQPEVSQVASTSSAPAPSVIRQIETVSADNSGRTLAIVLAAIALAVALCSLGYSTIRVMQIQRRQLGSGTH
jgi:hypothetical protein